MFVIVARGPRNLGRTRKAKEKTPMPLESYLKEFTPLLRVDPKAVQTLVDALIDAYKSEKGVYIIGNGGSGANASHLAEDLGKGTLTDFDNQKRLKVMSLTDNTPWILALG